MQFKDVAPCVVAGQYVEWHSSLMVLYCVIVLSLWTRHMHSFIFLKQHCSYPHADLLESPSWLRALASHFRFTHTVQRRPVHCSDTLSVTLGHNRTYDSCFSETWYARLSKSIHHLVGTKNANLKVKNIWMQPFVSSHLVISNLVDIMILFLFDFVHSRWLIVTTLLAQLGIFTYISPMVVTQL